MTNVKVSGLLGVAVLVLSANGCGQHEPLLQQLPGGLHPQRQGRNARKWVELGSPQFISEESPNNVSYCPQNSIVEGMYTTGSYSDNIAIQCRDVNFPPQGVTCRWTNWVSEEQPPQYFDADFNRPGGAVATAVMCSGSYCDNVSFLACEPRCTSDADCGVYRCSTTNHWCVVG